MVDWRLVTSAFVGHENMSRRSEVAKVVRRRTMRAALLALLMSLTLIAWPQQKQADLTNLSIEDLMNFKVTSVSKTQQSLSRAASAIFVITPEAIRRSGANNIPDLLRMVPGLDVAQINANTWAVSARGFNAKFSNELLVLMDGRTVYTPTFGGVFWDVLDLPLGDIERIEVIRGPGGSLWGANAVNGVVNIITRKSSATLGAHIVAGYGNVEQGFGTVQYGGAIRKRTDYRVYTKYFNQGQFPSKTGADGEDGWRMLRGGFRSDSVLSAKDTLMCQGDIYSAREGLPTSDISLIPSPATQDIELLPNIGGGFLQGCLESHLLGSLQHQPPGRLRYLRTKRSTARGSTHLRISTFSTISIWGLGRRSSGEGRIAIQSLDRTDSWASHSSPLTSTRNSSVRSSMTKSPSFRITCSSPSGPSWSTITIRASASCPVLAWPGLPRSYTRCGQPYQKRPGPPVSKMPPSVRTPERLQVPEEFRCRYPLRQSACRQRGVHRL